MTKKSINISVPTLIDTQQFHPTCTMQKVLLAHLKEISDPERDNITNPPKFLAAMGHDRTNWYKWQKQQGFWQWWYKAIEEELQGGILNKVHANLAKLAMTQRDSSIIKLFLERFDRKYKPTTKQDHDFPGIAPPTQEEMDAAIERSKAMSEKYKRITSKDITEQQRQKDNDVSEIDGTKENIGTGHTPPFEDAGCM